jgi:PsbN protein
MEALVYTFLLIGTLIVIFVSSLLLGITAYSVYTAFGPASKNLRDPFEEHED